MINEGQYVVFSLELHMFFGRIMKEHSLFLEAGFTPPNADFAKTAVPVRSSLSPFCQPPYNYGTVLSALMFFHLVKS